jgi:uncharacterized protein YndB with AHSA1/START domain
MSEQSWTTSFTVDRTPGAVYEAITDVRSWWLEQIEGDTQQVGDEFSFQVPGVHRSRLRVTELVPGERVVWRVLDNHMSFVADQSEWIGTEIRFELSAVGGATELRFTHEGLVPGYECFDVCSNAWGSYIGGSLRDLVTTGRGNPSSNPDETRLQDQRVGRPR